MWKHLSGINFRNPFSSNIFHDIINWRTCIINTIPVEQAHSNDTSKTWKSCNWIRVSFSYEYSEPKKWRNLKVFLDGKKIFGDVYLRWKCFWINGENRKISWEVYWGGKENTALGSKSISCYSKALGVCLGAIDAAVYAGIWKNKQAQHYSLLQTKQENCAI